MILNERLFENTSSNEDKELSVEDMFKYLKEYPQYNHQYTRPVRYNDLGLSDEQVDEFFEFLNDACDGLAEFWNQNDYLAQNIYQEGRMGGHLVLDSDILEPKIFDDVQSVSDMVEHNLEDNYYPNNDDGTYDERQQQDAREDVEKEIKDSYITLKDFDDRVDQLIDNLKATLDARIENKANNENKEFNEEFDADGDWFYTYQALKNVGSVQDYSEEFEFEDEAINFAKDHDYDRVVRYYYPIIDNSEETWDFIDYVNYGHPKYNEEIWNRADKLIVGKPYNSNKGRNILESKDFKYSDEDEVEYKGYIIAPFTINDLKVGNKSLGGFTKYFIKKGDAYYKDKDFTSVEDAKKFIDSATNKKKVKESIDYTDENYLYKPYWYLTRHGMGPGSVPAKMSVWTWFETPEGTYFASSKVISKQELEEYEIVEKQPNLEDIPEKSRIDIQNFLETPISDADKNIVAKENLNIKEDIEKTKSGKWVNVGKEGTHGEFTTKKAAREQQKAMFAQGFKSEALENTKRFKWELFDQNDRLIDSESGFASEEEAKQNAIREIDVYNTILKKHPEYTFRIKEFVENIDSDDDRFDMVDDTNESFDPASVVYTIREFLQEHPFENEDDDRFEDFEEYIANELFDKEVKELTSEESYAISDVWESLNESLSKEPFKPMSYEQAKKYFKDKRNIDLTKDLYQDIMSLGRGKSDESLYQTDSVSGNKMTFEVTDDGKFIVKDGEKVILNTKVVDVQDTKNQIKSMQDIEILREGYTPKQQRVLDAFYKDMNFGFDSNRVIINKVTDNTVEFTLDGVSDIYKLIKESKIEDLNENPGDEEKIDPTAGLETVLNDLINDENEAINGYNSAIVNFEVEGRGDLTQVFRDIIKDEQNHIGNLQKVLNEINPDTLKNIQDGQKEAEETLQSDSTLETEETNE